MNPLPEFPPEVYRYVSKVFSLANRRLAEKIARVPNCPEPSLDLTLIEHLSQYSGARLVVPGWAVRIDVHYLGGMRHFRGWEIADIGFLVFAKKGGHLHSSKVALLQSKRLYPIRHGILEESEYDYQIGFSRLLPSQKSTLSLGAPRQYDFTPASSYSALRKGDKQYTAIEHYEAHSKLPVHYLLYNPWNLATSYQLPVGTLAPLGPKGNGGARVIPAVNLRTVLAPQSDGYTPTYADLGAAISVKRGEAHGWRLETFVADLLLKCKQGALYDDPIEDRMFDLFNRRSGPIAAAVGVTIEQID